MPKTLMKGNEVIGAAAINAGCRYFFGYPITPQTELPEYMAGHLGAAGGVFVQAESEAVSYTHLDVYKRQLRHPRGSLSCQVVRRLHGQPGARRTHPRCLKAHRQVRTDARVTVQHPTQRHPRDA